VKIRLFALAILLAAAGLLVWKLVPSRKPPNVLIILWDTARADRMSLYGHSRPTTPRLEAWAQEAAVFERASSAGIWTLPSHASLFTGLPPESHGANERWLWLDERFLTMAEHFRDHGYATFTLAANSLLCEETNLVQGFDVRLTTYKGRLAKAAKAATRRKVLPQDKSNELAPGWAPPSHGAHNAEWARQVYKEAAPLAGQTFLEWLQVRKTQDKPFFAFINLMEAHTPRIPSQEAREAVLQDDPSLIPLGLETDAGHINLHFYNFGKYDLTDRQLEAIRGVYDATLWDLDRATVDLFDGLEKMGVLDDTIVVLTADHGENLGDHHLFNHRFSLWDSLVHVPLVMRYPDAVPAGRISEPVSTISLFATLSRLAGLPVPASVEPTDLLKPEQPAVTHLAVPLVREIQTVKNVHPDVPVEPWLRSGHAVIEGSHKLITMTDGTRDLYNLQTDPAELTPIDDPALTQRLSQEIEEWLARWPAYDPSERGTRDDPAHVKASQEELREMLEAMGYVTGEEGDPQP
jgi:arylsulfatase A-like enzyme